jgi:hypothetical protein
LPSPIKQNAGKTPAFFVFSRHFREGALERFRAKWMPGSREENASNQEAGTSVLIQSEPIRL